MYYTLFKALVDFCPSDYRGYFSTLKENSEKSFGIFFKGGTPMDRSINTGENLVKVANVTFNINGSKSKDGILDSYNFCENIINNLEKVFNHTFYDYERKKFVNIISVEIISDVNSLGFNKFDVPCYSLNILVKYRGGNF